MASVWLLDTHIWIRLLAEDPELRRPRFLQQLAEVQASGGLRVADISLWETAMLVSKGRLVLEFPVRDWLEKAVAVRGLLVVPINPAIAADSASLPGEFHGDPADRLLVATARHLPATLVTLDGAILEYSKLGWVATLDPKKL